MFKKFFNKLGLVLTVSIISLTVLVCYPCYTMAKAVSVKDAVNEAKAAATQIFRKDLKDFCVFTCTDLIGKPTAYCVTFQTGEGNPSLSGIKAKIAQELSIEKGLEEALQAEKDQTRRIEIMKKLQKSYAALRHDGEFVTVITSADTEKEPIIMMYESLPFQIVGVETAMNKIQGELTTSNLEFKGIVYLGSLNLYFEFFADKTPVYSHVGSMAIKYQPDLAILAESDTDGDDAGGPGWTNSSLGGGGGGGPISQTYYYNYISGVPDLQQTWYEGDGDCAPVSGANIFCYADTHGYPNFPDDDTLVEDLKDAMDYEDPDGVGNSDIGPGMAEVSNDYYYDFDYDYDSSASFSAFIGEVNAGRPSFDILVEHDDYGGDDCEHATTCVGYYIYYDYGWREFTIVHDNWPSTTTDVYIYWNDCDHRIVEIYPGY